MRALGVVATAIAFGPLGGCALDRAGIAADAAAERDANAVDAAAERDALAVDAAAERDASACSEVSCDDRNPCTDDRCVTGLGCEHTPNEAPCDDGQLCNGRDRCQDGACTGHDFADPCPDGSSCDPTRNACVGCESDADCPPGIAGPYGECTFDPDDVCVEEGIQRRTVTSYRCIASVCEPTTRTEERPCTRETTGRECAPPIVDEWGPCTYPDACSERGSRSRAVTTSRCAGGTCVATRTFESDSTGCDRSTAGMPCGSPSPGSWSPCGGFDDVCDETGMEQRSVVQPVCMAGACSGSMTTVEMRACTRETDGTPCDARMCGDFSPCRPASSSSACDTSGTQSRTCYDPVCTAGTCASGPSIVETRACTYDPTGTSCIDWSDVDPDRDCGPCVRRLLGCSRTCTVPVRTCMGDSCTGAEVGTFDVLLPCDCPYP